MSMPLPVSSSRSMSGGSRKSGPVAPPVYRPKPKTVQAPPVYRPQPGVQAKMPGGHPNAPPVYRPQARKIVAPPVYRPFSPTAQGKMIRPVIIAPAMNRVAGVRGVIQPMWVFIGEATKKTNMTDDGAGWFTSHGKRYRKTGSRDGYPVVELVSSASPGSSSADSSQSSSSSSSASSSSPSSPSSPSSNEDEEMSQYSQHSLEENSDEELEKMGGRSKRVLEAYRGSKHMDLDEGINTHEGLQKVVNTFDTAKSPAANTHVLYRNEDDDKYNVTSIGTANAVKLYLKRFSFEELIKNVQAVHGKGKHVHTEMHLLYQLTGGDASKINGCLAGYILVVDKAVCQDCYAYVVRANPAEVRDGTNFNTDKAATRPKYEWSNPFR
jgi:hypothetical protein